MTPPTETVVRTALPAEYEPLGELVVAAYRDLPGAVVEAGYETALRAVRLRAEEATVFVAVEAATSRLLGCVTYVGTSSSPWAEQLEVGEGAIRMLAVAPDAQRRGVGEALTRACIDRARADGLRGLCLHSTPWMSAAHRLYERLGFHRVPERDWLPDPQVPLLTFVLPL